MGNRWIKRVRYRPSLKHACWNTTFDNRKIIYAQTNVDLYFQKVLYFRSLKKAHVCVCLNLVTLNWLSYKTVASHRRKAFGIKWGHVIIIFWDWFIRLIKMYLDSIFQIPQQILVYLSWFFLCAKIIRGKTNFYFVSELQSWLTKYCHPKFNPWVW